MMLLYLYNIIKGKMKLILVEVLDDATMQGHLMAYKLSHHFS